MVSLNFDTESLNATEVALKRRPSDGLIKDKFHLFFSGALQNAVIARH